MADIPGLIEGAHEGAGLGDEFLRHIERTRVILHLIDVGSEFPAAPPCEAYRVIREELFKYSPELAAKEELVVGSKLDLSGEDDGILSELTEAIGKQVHPISAVSGAGLKEMTENLWAMVQRVKTFAVESADRVAPTDAPNEKNA